MSVEKDIQHDVIAVLGKSPQILTETLYALCVLRKTPITEVNIITTTDGVDIAQDCLSGTGPGSLKQLIKDYPKYCSNIHFSPQNIFIAEDGLMPVADIRTRTHSDLFFETILKVLWRKTESPHVALHCSLAGGRKTMSAYMALALQLLGREQDALYHVLVDPIELESHKEFYFPPAQSTFLTLRNGQRFDASTAKIDLVDVPFIRLRERMQIDRYKHKTGYRQRVEWVQRDINKAVVLPDLVLEPEKKALIIGQEEIKLQPQRFCLYWYFADRSKHRLSSVSTSDYAAYFEPSASPFFSQQMRDGLIARFDFLDRSGEMSETFRERILEGGELPSTWVASAISRINAQLRVQLSQAQWLPFYLISAEGKRGNKFYGINLDREKIVTPEFIS